MRRRQFIAGLGTSVACPIMSFAQQPAKVARIGWLTAQRAESLAPYVDAFRASLAALGYAEGRNLDIAFLYGDDVVARVPELAAELCACLST